MNSRYKTLFGQLDTNENLIETVDLNTRVLIVDGLNSFIRVFSANPLLNEDGMHIGGYIGFLQSISNAIKMVNATRCIIAFDGVGGSQHRKKMYSGYKEGRSLTGGRYNRVEDVGAVTLEDETESMKRQLGRLYEYLQCLPINIVMLDAIEADDSIAYLTNQYFKPRNSTVYIMSDDKDFLQLIDEKTFVWRPVQKKLYDIQTVIDTFGVHPANFIHYKVFMGDSSDNIKGVKGVGIKTLQKEFPMLMNSSTVPIEEIYDHCDSNSKKKKVYRTILESKDVVSLNWRLMSLDQVDISGTSKARLRAIADENPNRYDPVTLKKMSVSDKAFSGMRDLDAWLRTSCNQLS
jgi:DNA polymerase-1